MPSCDVSQVLIYDAVKNPGENPGFIHGVNVIIRYNSFILPCMCLFCFSADEELMLQ